MEGGRDCDAVTRDVIGVVAVPLTLRFHQLKTPARLNVCVCNL
jgi:hypothetical protein